MSDRIPARRLRRALKNTFAKDLSAFLERAFRDLDPGKPFHHGEYIEYLVTVLREVAEGRERRVIINLPPRHLKSILASIVFPAWLLGQRPQERIAVISHNQDLDRDTPVSPVVDPHHSPLGRQSGGTRRHRGVTTFHRSVQILTMQNQ